jgi:hypothetical protein
MIHKYSTNLMQQFFILIYTQVHVAAVSWYPQAVYNYVKRENYNYMCDIIKIVLDG